MADPPVDQFPDFHEPLSKLIDKYWTRCVDLGLDVVLDLGFWSRHQRDETRAAAVALGASARLYRLECPDDEAWQRVATRNLYLEGTYASSETLSTFLRVVLNLWDTMRPELKSDDSDHVRTLPV